MTFFLIFLSIILLQFLLVKNTSYVYDLSHNRTCNYFEIYNINNLKKYIPILSNKIIIDDYLPNGIIIQSFTKKGWGLVSKNSFKKGDIIYKAPIYIYPKNGIQVTSKTLGIKNICKDIHCGDIENKFDLFSCYDCFLNHSYNPSAYHDDLLLIENGAIYIILKAAHDIYPETELTINYLYLNIQ